MPPNDSTDVLMRLVRLETRMDSSDEAKKSEHADLWEAVSADKKELGEAMKELATRVAGLEKARNTLNGVKIALYGVGVILLALAGLVVNMQIIISRFR